MPYLTQNRAEIRISLIHTSEKVGPGMVSDDAQETTWTRGKARTRAYGTILEIISNMALESDAFLHEEDLARASGVSRTPVREALQRLEGEGLVRLVAKRGAYVSMMGSREIWDILELRQMLEAKSAVTIASEQGEVTLQRLYILLEQHESAVKRGAKQRELMILDRNFHSTIVAASQNSLLVDAYERLRNLEMRMMITVIGSAGKERWQEALKEHREILDAIGTGNGKGIELAVVGHCRSTAKAAERGLVVASKRRMSPENEILNDRMV